MSSGDQRKSRRQSQDGPKRSGDAAHRTGGDRRSRSDEGVRGQRRGPARDSGRDGGGARGKKTGLRRPERRSAGAKLTNAAAGAVRAGHPWVFRDALARPSADLSPGSLVPVADADGYRLGWGLYEPEGSVALRMVSHDPNFEWNQEVMGERLKAAVGRRAKWVEQGLIPASTHRVVHGESDGLPGIAIDKLGDRLLIYKYARCAESYLDQLVELIMKEVEPRSLYMQDRLRPVTANERRPPAFHMGGEVAPAEYEVDEDGLKFVVDITAPVSPGLFLDLREGRRLMEGRVKGGRVLNLFSFTGAFGLRGVRAGAESVTNVDAAARSHARCRQNLAASGMDAEACEALSGDVFKFLARFGHRQRLFDFVVVDPPPFSNVDGKKFSALRDWSDLMRDICPVVAPGGFVLAVCNATALSDQDFLVAVGRGGVLARREIRLVGEWGLPPDFPVLPAFTEGRYLKIKLLQLN